MGSGNWTQHASQFCATHSCVSCSFLQPILLSPGSPPLGDFESDHDEAPASPQATAVPDTPVPPAPFPQDVLQASEDMGMDLRNILKL